MKVFIKSLSVLAILLEPVLAGQDYIDLKSDKIEYYTGVNIRYYKEYAPKQFEGVTSFPVHRCDPVPIDNIGNLKVFFTSAIEGHQPLSGQGIVIPTPESLTKIIVVRGKSESSGHRVEVYAGYNPDDYELKGRYRNKIHKAVLLALQVKDTHYVENRLVHLLSDAQYLTSWMIGTEIKKRFSDSKDWNWNGEVFQQHFQQMIPKRAGFYIMYQTISLHTPYWTKDENKLKGIKYH